MNRTETGHKYVSEIAEVRGCSEHGFRISTIYRAELEFDEASGAHVGRFTPSSEGPMFCGKLKPHLKASDIDGFG